MNAQFVDWSIDCFANVLSMLNTLSDTDGRMKHSDSRSKHSAIMYLQDVFICRQSTMASTRGIMYFYIFQIGVEGVASTSASLDAK